jgi:hypothetical protein
MTETFDESGTVPVDDASEAVTDDQTTFPEPDAAPLAPFAFPTVDVPAAPDVDVVPASAEQTDAIERELNRAPADPAAAFPHVALADGDVATAIPMGEESSHRRKSGHRVKRHIIHNGKDYHPGDTIDASDEAFDDKTLEQLHADGALEHGSEETSFSEDE